MVAVRFGAEGLTGGGIVVRGGRVGGIVSGRPEGSGVVELCMTLAVGTTLWRTVVAAVDGGVVAAAEGNGVAAAGGEVAGAVLGAELWIGGGAVVGTSPGAYA